MTVRITLALLAVVPAALAYPWHSPTERWVLGVGIAVVIVVFAWWRGLFVTTMIRRRLAVWRRNHSTTTPTPSARVSVLLAVEAPGGAAIPLSVVAGYVDRFGVRCARVRVTNTDDGGARRTLIGLTLAAADNLAALAARSPTLPLSATAEIVGRRLADQLRELGLDAVIVDGADGPHTPQARETWRAMKDDDGYLAAYAVPVDAQLPGRLGEVWSHTHRETWTALEFSGTASRPTVVAVCAVRTDGPPTGVPVPGVKRQPGRQGPLLTALDPRSEQRLDVDPVVLPDGLLDLLVWPVGSASSTMGAHARL